MNGLEVLRRKMALPGNLTSSGMLYEGNYEELELSIRSILEMHSYDVDHYDFGDHLEVEFELNPTVNQEPRIASIIRDQVSAALMDRIPRTNHKKPNELLRNLQEYAKPFRLNDLPSELRCRIYKFHFARKKQYWILAGGVWDSVIRQPTSRLLLVSRAIKNEAAPLFFGNAEICFYSHSTCHNRREDYLIERQMRSWVEDYMRENVKFLRRMRLELRETGWHYVITLSLNMHTGLKVEYSGNVPKERKVAWFKHIVKVEANRKAFGWQGEALVLAFTSRPELWEEKA
ncbi:hypothetical protein LTR17_004732 [Elasticomyces elasticus]|nr:hypothetical protein LTR17_004732 [Elasticomyces elasticus]